MAYVSVIVNWFSTARVIATATIVYAVTTIVMYFAIRSQAKAAHRQADKIEGQLAEMQAARQKTEEMIRVMRETAKRELRAYLTVIIGTAAFQDRPHNVKFHGMPTMLNSGRTPAYKVSYSMRGGILPVPLPENFELPPLHKNARGESIVGPQQSVSLLEGGRLEDFVADQDVEGIKNLSIGKGLYVGELFLMKTFLAILIRPFSASTFVGYRMEISSAFIRLGTTGPINVVTTLNDFLTTGGAYVPRCGMRVATVRLLHGGPLTDIKPTNPRHRRHSVVTSWLVRST
jgi:hypothetical protein